jgi:UDP-N-acetylglucosamine--N-acetylmuramyl-(pentapeptide) pyrophosphoryl-undecaprenol N-acetylglucosamine transferase
MVDLYPHASLVVSRAGGTTLAEIACAGLPTLLVPYPHAAGNHQWHNAEFFRKAGAARVWNERTDASDPEQPFAGLLRGLLEDAQLRRSMSARMATLAKPSAASEVVDLLEKLRR